MKGERFRIQQNYGAALVVVSFAAVFGDVTQRSPRKTAAKETTLVGNWDTN